MISLVRSCLCRLATAFVAATLATPALAASCPMVSVEQIEAALPDYAPWHLDSGGPGACQFRAEYEDEQGSSSTVSLQLLQQFHPSPKAAAEMMRTLRTEFAKASTIKPISLRGAAPGAFTYGVDAKGSHQGFWWYAQVGRAILSGMYMPAAGLEVDADEEAAVLAVVQTAVGDTAAPTTAAKAAQCPDFDEALIKKLIPGKNVSIERFGSNSCLAKNEKNAVVMFSRLDNVDPTSAGQIAQSATTACTFEPVPTLGELGRISYNCTMGNKHAAVNFYKNQAWFDFSVIPNGEPTAKQRADLIELANRRYAQPE
jgi:hypothetical protein